MFTLFIPHLTSIVPDICAIIWN